MDQGDRHRRSKSQLRLRDEEDGSDNDRRSRATTPGRSLLEEVKSLKPVGDRNIKGRTTPQQPPEEKCELKNHFRDFMKTPALVKRGRSFSQPRDKDKPGSETESLSRKESFEEKIVEDGLQQEKGELANHTKRFLKRKSLITRNKMSDESDTDSIVRDKPVEKDNREITPSDNDIDDSTTNLVVSKPPPAKTTAEQQLYRRVRPTNTEIGEYKPSRRFDRRIRSKSDITVPKIYDMDSENHNEIEDDADTSRSIVQEDQTNGVESKSDVTEETAEQTESLESNVETLTSGVQKDIENEISNSVSQDRPRVRKNNLNSNTEYLYMSANIKVPNSNPKPFVASPTKEKSPPTYPAPSEPDDTSTKTISRQESNELPDVKHIEQSSSSPHVSTQIQTEQKKFYSKESSVFKEEPEKTYNNYVYIENGSMDRRNSDKSDYYEKKLSDKLVNGKVSEKKVSDKQLYSQDNSSDRKSSDKYNNSDYSYKYGKSFEKISDKTREGTEDRKYMDRTESIPSSYSTSTSDIMNACKSGLRRLTYRKTYSRTRSTTLEPEQDNNNNSSNRTEALDKPKTTYTQLSSGTRLPSRPTTPGPYLTATPDRTLTSGLYSKIKRPTTPGPFTRDSWKRTNQKFNYNKILNCSGHETYV